MCCFILRLPYLTFALIISQPQTLGHLEVMGLISPNSVPNSCQDSTCGIKLQKLVLIMVYLRIDIVKDHEIILMLVYNKRGIYYSAKSLPRKILRVGGRGYNIDKGDHDHPGIRDVPPYDEIMTLVGKR